MAQIIIEEDDVPILVDLSPTILSSGEEEVSKSPLNFLEKSQKGINHSMATILGMTKKMAKLIRSMPLVEKPDEVHMQFGLKIDLEGNSFIVRGQAETNINVNLIWKESNKKK